MSESIKMTSQRELVLDYVQNSYAHPTAVEIYKHLKKKLPRISKKTVYNNLQVLSEAGLLREISTMGVKKYEPATKPHHHLICQVCDSVLDIEEEELTNLATQVGEKLKDFDVRSTTTHFYGVCRDCKGGDDMTEEVEKTNIPSSETRP
jgi:Fur family ferric uptake transcriptional regulator